MECPHCGSGDISVVDSRPSKDAIRRRRECADCQHRFTTYERVAELEPAVIKRDGRREPFQPGKIRHGIRLAAAKRPLPEGELDGVVESVRTLAVQSGRAEIPSATLGEWVSERLQILDRVTAFRFAAVFRRPDDTDALRRELAAAESAAPTTAARAPQPRLPGIAPDGASQISASNGGGRTVADTPPPAEATHEPPPQPAPEAAEPPAGAD